MTDNVNHPSHYQGFSNGAEVIDITENLSFNLGNVVKYVARAGRKTDDPAEDLRKARFYLNREIQRVAGPDGDILIDEFRKVWDLPRRWDRIEHVPPNTIVQDLDGDWYQRAASTCHFHISFDDGENWQSVDSDALFPNDFGPFTEVDK